MKTLQGTYGKDCKIFTDNIEPQALETIQKLLDNPVTEGKPVRIMPDTHDGKGIVIGFTMPMDEWVNPNHIGVDIGCGMLCVEIKNTITPDMYPHIEKTIREHIPMGFNIHDTPTCAFHAVAEDVLLNVCKKVGADFRQVLCAIGTLGGGNHFIELGRSEQTGQHFLTIHSGSRNFGKRVCDWHAKSVEPYKQMLAVEMDRIKQTLPKQQWNDAIKDVRKQLAGRESYLMGEAKKAYLEDMRIAQTYAECNRHAIADIIFGALDWEFDRVIETPHNYISSHDNIIRKGAVSARDGELLVIPMNMADGILLCKGKGNPDWNCSAPHGAGRLLSRTAAHEQLSMEEFKQRMSSVYSTSVCESTLDESPMAYKPTEEIRALIEPTVHVMDVIKPVINLKAK